MKALAEEWKKRDRERELLMKKKVKEACLFFTERSLSFFLLKKPCLFFTERSLSIFLLKKPCLFFY